MAWYQIILFANCSAKGNQQDIPSDPAKKLCLRFHSVRYSQHLVVQRCVMRPQSSETTCLAKYPALTLSNLKCHVKTYPFKQAFNLQQSICFVYFIIYHLLSFYFILKSCYLFVNFIQFQSFFLTYCKVHLIICHGMLCYISFNYYY